MNQGVVELLEPFDTRIAGHTEQTADDPRSVVMVDVEAAGGLRTTADRTDSALLLKQHVVSSGGDPVAVLEVPVAPILGVHDIVPLRLDGLTPFADVGVGVVGGFQAEVPGNLAADSALRTHLVSPSPLPVRSPHTYRIRRGCDGDWEAGQYVPGLIQ